MNIIFGVIIDTFGDLREQNENLVDELENKCFVCGHLSASFAAT